MRVKLYLAAANGKLYEFDSEIYELNLPKRESGYIYSDEYDETIDDATNIRYRGLPTPNNPDKKLPDNASFEEIEHKN